MKRSKNALLTGIEMNKDCLAYQKQEDEIHRKTTDFNRNFKILLTDYHKQIDFMRMQHFKFVKKLYKKYQNYEIIITYDQNKRKIIYVIKRGKALKFIKKMIKFNEHLKFNFKFESDKEIFDEISKDVSKEVDEYIDILIFYDIVWMCIYNWFIKKIVILKKIKYMENFAIKKRRKIISIKEESIKSYEEHLLKNIETGNKKIKEKVKIKWKKEISRKIYAKRKNIIENFTENEWVAKRNTTNGICPKCNTFVGIEKLTLDHIFPVSKAEEGRIYTINDVQPLCKSCNARKNDNMN